MNRACLNARTEYSPDSVAPLAALVDRAAEFRVTALGKADRASLLGTLDFFAAARRRGIHPVAGVELELASILEGDALSLAGLTAPITFPIVLHAETDAGFRSLIRLVSRANNRAGVGAEGLSAAVAPRHPHGRGGAGRPFITLADLETEHDGLIAQSPGLTGEVQSRILRGQVDLAERLALRLAGVFGRSSFFAGIALHGSPAEARLAAETAALAERLGIGLIAANEIDHLDPDDAPARDVRRSLIGDVVGAASHFRSSIEVRRLFHDHPAALDTAAEVAARCHAEPGRVMEGAFHYPLPAGRGEASYLASLCSARLPRDPRYERRLGEELRALSERGLAGWFLLLRDLVNYARARGIDIGPGRGALAHSLAARQAGITEIDPVAHALPFERFLEEAAGGLPEVALDLEGRGRAELKAYLEQRLGPDQVAHALRAERYTPRAAVSDVGAARGFHDEEVTFMARRFSEVEGADVAAWVARETRLARLYRQDERVRSWLDTARRLQGLPRAFSPDPGHLIVAPGPVADHAPLLRVAHGLRVVQLTGTEPWPAGLLRLRFSPARCSADPPERGDESRPGTDRPRIAVRDVADVSVRRLAGRGRDVRQLYEARRDGKESWSITEPPLAAALERTQGLLVEQEQIVEIVTGLVGWTSTDAEHFRRLATGEEAGPTASPAAVPSADLAAWRYRFVRDAVERGMEIRRAEEIFMGIVHAAPATVDRAGSVALAVACRKGSRPTLAVVHPPGQLPLALGGVNPAEGSPPRTGTYGRR